MNTAPLRTRKTALALAALLALGLARSPDAQAAACTFNPASGNWNVAANWSCGSIPGAGDNATVGASSTVTIPGGFAAGTASLNNAGTVGVSNNSTLTLRGSNQNAGSIQLNSVGNLTDLAISGATSLNGSGGIDTTNWFSNRIVSASNNASDVLTLGAGQFVRGAGQIGAGGPLGLINNGSLIANQSAGMTLSTSGSVTNNKVIRGDGAVFTISATTVNQGAAGVLDAINGGSVTLTNGSKIIGGTFTSDSGSAVSVASGHNARLSGVTNSGNLTLANSASLYLDGTLTNNGSLNLNSVGNNTDLITSGNQLIDGSGTITLSNRSSNRIRAATAGDRLTLGANQTLQGSGEIGAGSGLIFDNTGTVIATQSAPLLINAASVNNTGTLRADGGTLQLQTTINSAGGQIEARNGSRVELLSGTIINDAAFSATGAGSLITTVGGATVTLGGGTVNGPMSVANNSVLRLSGDLSYNGALTLNSVGNNTDLQIDGARALGGNLSIGTSNWAANRILARNASGDVLTLGGSVTMQGAGQIGAGGSLGLINNGSLIANQSAGMT
ncbi:MAG: hypothetical protein LC125_11300, partial [Burkholderiales bacterium]|nr:hypothetical protein [Burkholderiales bacterium]